jgi:hypothetical protein
MAAVRNIVCAIAAFAALSASAVAQTPGTLQPSPLGSGTPPPTPKMPTFSSGKSDQPQTKRHSRTRGSGTSGTSSSSDTQNN